MFGIPTLTTDYSNDPAIFNPELVLIDPSQSRETNIYWIHKAMVSAYRKAGLSNSIAKDVAAHNASQIFDQRMEELKNSGAISEKA